MRRSTAAVNAVCLNNVAPNAAPQPADRPGAGARIAVPQLRPFANCLPSPIAPLLRLSL